MNPKPAFLVEDDEGAEYIIPILLLDCRKDIAFSQNEIGIKK